ncbi:protein U13.5 [Proboscivirus elephantidbeta4]|uniref:Protein U13.5 n=1 Tax=Elephant endotheliotropic herpesvirus 4 TaxID=548914 RepID=A0A0S1TP46_9BETA|nr:protein U13.5 [Elephant endotheliotropic herpesvirus 4]ALM25970.1 protein U13.5 [Elephant endotheliotropic herpesvirus 4]
MSNNNNTTTTKENQKTLILRKYRRGLKSEEKKKIFHSSLTNYSISRRLPRCTVKPSLIFCTPEKTKVHERFFQNILRHRNKAVQTEQVLRALSKISCSVRKDSDLGHAVYDIVANINKVSFVSRMKALKKRVVMEDPKLLISLLVQLTKKNAVLKFAIHFFIDNFVCIGDHKRLCHLLLGLLHMDPHMWSRSLVMLDCVRTTVEQLLIRFFLKTDRNPYNYITCNIDNYISMYRTAGVNLSFMERNGTTTTCSSGGTGGGGRGGGSSSNGTGVAMMSFSTGANNTCVLTYNNSNNNTVTTESVRVGEDVVVIRKSRKAVVTEGGCNSSIQERETVQRKRGGSNSGGVPTAKRSTRRVVIAGDDGKKCPADIKTDMSFDAGTLTGDESSTDGYAERKLEALQGGGEAVVHKQEVEDEKKNNAEYVTTKCERSV